MLPAVHRLRGPAEFAATIRTGQRASAGSLVVHLRPTGADDEPRAGFVVSRKIGNSVVRHRVTRRLRPIVRARLPDLPRGTRVVVRALPAAATAAAAALASDFGTALRRAGRDRSRADSIAAERRS